MNGQHVTRRQFVRAASLAPLVAAASRAVPAYGNLGRTAGKAAILGGKPIRAKPFARWPIWDKNNDEQRILSVLRSGVWSRAKVVAEFEKKYAEMVGAKRCLATTHGTTALLTALNVLGVGVGD